MKAHIMGNRSLSCAPKTSRKPVYATPPPRRHPYVLVRLRCDTCKRAGSYRLARLAVKYGAEIGPQFRSLTQLACSSAAPDRRMTFAPSHPALTSRNPRLFARNVAARPCPPAFAGAQPRGENAFKVELDKYR
jgi:hypothetical protein